MIDAHYEYAPFGALTVTIGESAFTNYWRFSSEYADDNLALLYYNYRYYNLDSGKWLSRDRIGEIGGANVYSFLRNNVANVFDIHGLKSYDSSHYNLTGCILTVSMGIKFVFDDSNGKWNLDEILQWKQKAVDVVKGYFNGGYVKYRNDWYHEYGVNLKDHCFVCKSKCAKKCKQGIHVRFEFKAVDKNYDYILTVCKGNLRSGVNTDDLKSKIKRYLGENMPENLYTDGYLAESDNEDNGEQVVLLHEIGHLLGMEHPGQTDDPNNPAVPNSKEDYDADAKSLMGRGMQLRKWDFDEAFCSHINSKYGKTYGGGWKADAQTQSVRRRK
jgi:RHS repeat-associated protein